MKKLLKILSIFLMIAAVTLSCSRDDDPVDNDFFAGTYKGKVSYSETGGTNISSNDGSVFVTKIGSANKYNFAFSNGIPDLVNVEFNTNGNTMVNVGNTATAYISINNKDLDIYYVKDGKTWIAECSR